MPHAHLTGGRPPNPPLLLLHEIGDLIRATGLSQSRLGQVLGVSTRAIRYWRDGTTAPPKMAVILMKIIAAQHEKRLAEAEVECGA
jgi:DNA-binding transcriptional regulator YiaG